MSIILSTLVTSLVFYFTSLPSGACDVINLNRDIIQTKFVKIGLFLNAIQVLFQFVLVFQFFLQIIYFSCIEFVLNLRRQINWNQKFSFKVSESFRTKMYFIILSFNPMPSVYLYKL